MTTELLPERTAMGAVSLDVADLDAQTAFYRDVILLDVLGASGDLVELGRGGVPLVRLRHAPGLPKGQRRSAGLFHTALLHPDRAALAATLASVATRASELYTGAGDHLVSQAFYLDDPEGNGIELYWDRPRSEWSWDANGQVQMTTLGIDPNAFLAEHLDDAGRDLVETAAANRPAVGELGADTIGHVHLKVGDADQARGFYVDLLGFELTAAVRGAIFVSAGGYHHHMAMNTWNSRGAGLRAPELGLGRVDIVLPDAESIAQATARLRAGGVQVADTGAAVELADPWGNQIRLAADRAA